MDELTEYKHAHDYWEAEAKRLEAELAEAYQAADVWFSLVQKTKAELAEARRALLAGNDTVLANKKLQEGIAAQAARIAELERYKRIATTYHEYAEVIARAERAEAKLKATREVLEGMIAVAEGRFDGNPHADIDALAKARAALAR